MSIPNYWAIVPAAGEGKRMGISTPKQYLEVCGKKVIEHSLTQLIQSPHIKKIVVVIHQHDKHWQTTTLTHHPKIVTTLGGGERSDSVLNGLLQLSQHAAAEDWILVHDAARPCLKQSNLEKLIATVSTHNVGGILGVRAQDTMKRGDESCSITTTLHRDKIWHAQTPQMFRYRLLVQALQTAQAKKQHITDEASAIELLGHQPILVEGSRCNIKITQQEDLSLAEHYLREAYENWARV